MKILNPVVGVFIVIVLGLSYFVYDSYQNSQQANHASSSINHIHVVIKKIDELENSVIDLESKVRGYIISGNPAFIYNEKQNRDTVKYRIEELKILTGDNRVQLDYLAKSEQFAKAKIAFQDQLLTSFKKDPKQAMHLVMSLQGKKLTDSIRQCFYRMREEEKRLLSIRTHDISAVTHSRFRSTLVGVGVVLLLFSIGLFFINKENKLRRAAEKEAKDQEGKYKNLIENAAAVVCTINPQGEIDYISKKCFDISGYSPEEFKGKYFTHIVADNWKENVAYFYYDQFRQGAVETSFTFPIRTKSGEERWVEQTVVILKEGREMKGFQCIIIDITEKRRTEALLEQAAREIKTKKEEYQFRLQAILDNIPMIVYLKDLSGQFLMVNKHFRDAFNTSEEKILGKTAYEINEQEVVKRHIAVDEEVKRSLRSIETEDIVITKEGKRHMLVTKFPLFDKTGELFAICGVDKDITEMVHNRNEMVSARLRAEQAEKLQEEFLANMSHEIRTPMNGIVGMAHLLSDSELTATQEEYVQIIKSSSDSLLVLINDILDLSKIKAGRMSLEEIDFNIADVIDTVMLPMQVRAKAKNVVLKKSIDPNLPAFVWGDQHKLLQILNNLLSNAVKFTEKGNVHLDVRIKEVSNYVVIVQFSVTDTGIGIAKDKLDAVFESFVQAGTDMVRRFGGTGLGLAITKRLVQLQGGTIGVESEEGKGSTFQFEISYGRSELTAADAKQPVEAEVEETESLAGHKVLVVEDNEVNQKVIKTVLEKAGLVLTMANNGKVAVDILQSDQSFSLIIMDLQMPEMSGFQATTFIRNKLGLSTPIIAMTASALRDEKKKCFELGMNGYLTKPFAPAEILKHLASLLKGTEPQDIATEEKPASNELYNLSYLLEMDDADYIKEVLGIFLETTPVLLDEMRIDAMHENWEDVYRKAHKLKSSLGILQAFKMLEETTRIENLSKQREELDKVPSLIQSVLEQFNLIQPMLKAEIAEAA